MRRLRHREVSYLTKILELEPGFEPRQLVYGPITTLMHMTSSSLSLSTPAFPQIPRSGGRAISLISVQRLKCPDRLAGLGYLRQEGKSLPELGKKASLRSLPRPWIMVHGTSGMWTGSSSPCPPCLPVYFLPPQQAQPRV